MGTMMGVGLGGSRPEKGLGTGENGLKKDTGKEQSAPRRGGNKAWTEDFLREFRMLSHRIAGPGG